MDLLLLGGTRFLGRHIAEAASERGHRVTTFTRGREPASPQAAEALVGDRDPRIAPGLAALDGRAFDAVVDLSGYVPRVVAASAALLAPRVARYLFVSSVSAYADLSRPGVGEDAPLATLANPATEDVLPNYGALKAACERVVVERFGERATVVRPGLIVGPLDATDRFGYWVARFLHPSLLGERGPAAVVPAPPEAPIQLVDARDLAAFVVELLEHDVRGAYNAVSAPGQWSFGTLIDSLLAQAALPPTPAWIDEATLLAQGVEPWVGLPLWLPSGERDHEGFMRVDGARARAVGLRTRPLGDTIADTARWLAARDNARAWRLVMPARREREVLQATVRA